MESAEFGAGSHQASMAKGDLSHCHSAFFPDLGVSPCPPEPQHAEGLRGTRVGGGYGWESAPL